MLAVLMTAVNFFLAAGVSSRSSCQSIHTAGATTEVAKTDRKWAVHVVHAMPSRLLGNASSSCAFCLPGDTVGVLCGWLHGCVLGSL